MIRNTIYMIKDAAGGQDSALDRPIARMERSIARCDRIVEELLDYTRVRDLHCVSIAADRWLDDVLAECELPESVALVRKLAAPSCRLSADPDRLRQVVVNLIENAAQAMKELDPAKERLIIVSSRTKDDAFEFSIEDTGPGIPHEYLAKIFEPLFTTKSFGTGLGLPIVKQIVERHGGAVEIASEPGRGTVVVVRLPRVAAKEMAA